MKTYEEQCLEQAYKEDPVGRVCGFCGRKNNFADDCGYFYLFHTHKEGIPTCEQCHTGKPGQLHRKRFGVGER